MHLKSVAVFINIVNLCYTILIKVNICSGIRNDLENHAAATGPVSQSLELTSRIMSTEL
jgi:hypothetical protein